VGMSVLIIAASTPSIVLRYAAAFFLIVVAIGLIVALLRLAATLGRVDKLLADVDQEVVPLLNRVQITLDEVNGEFGKVDEIMTTVVDVTNKVDSVSRAVEAAVTLPAKKAAAFGAGVSQAVSSFFSRHGDSGESAEAGADWGASSAAAGWAATETTESATGAAAAGDTAVRESATAADAPADEVAT